MSAAPPVRVRGSSEHAASEHAASELALGELTLGERALGEPALDDLALGELASGEWDADDDEPGELALGTWDMDAPDADERRLHRMREQLTDLTRGTPVLLDEVDLVALCRLRYEGPDPEADPDAISAAAYALDHYLHHVGEQRRVGGNRARAMHYDACRYVLPHLLELRGGDSPPAACAWRVGDVTAFIQVLAGERDLPAATVAGDLLGRLAVTCHWLGLDDAAAVCGVTRAQIMSARLSGVLPQAITAQGRHVVRAMDLRAAGMLIEPDEPHGLSRDTAEHSLRFLQRSWAHARDHGARLVGDPGSAKTKKPLAHLRQRDPRPTARAYASIDACVQIAARLHPVHQFALWHARLLGMRAGEIFGLTLGDRDGDLLQVRAIGGAVRDMLAPDGTFVRAEVRAGTKGSEEGEVMPGTRAEGRGLHQRTVALPPALVRFTDSFDEVFHAHPATGRRDPLTRAVPGLREDDASGLQSFTAALAVACREVDPEGPAVTAHDLRASLITDLENRGVDDRLLRHFAGHQHEKGRSLDVHDRHYDLGADSAGMRQVAEAIQALLPEGLDLRVPTPRMVHFGTASRRATHATRIEEALLHLGWYRPASVACAVGSGDRPAGYEVTTKVAAARLGVSVTQVKRLLERGELAGRKAADSPRAAWLVSVESLDAYQARDGLLRLADLARQWDVPYYVLRDLARGLGQSAHRAPGSPILLTEEQAYEIRGELDRRAREADASMTFAEAAAELKVPEATLAALVRHGMLTATGARGRGSRVTRASVDAYAARYPFTAVAPGEKVVSAADVRDVLQVTRPAVSDLVRSRRLAVIEIGRRQFIGSASIRAYLSAHPCEGALERLALLEVDQP